MGFVLGAIAGAYAGPSSIQEWKVTEKSSGEVSRSASLKSSDGDIVALWMARGYPGDEIITYHDYIENGFRRVQFFYTGVVNNSLVLRKSVYYSYKTGFKDQPYYGTDEILHLPRTRMGHFELRSSQFKKIWFRITVNDAGHALVSAMPTKE